MPYYRGNRHNVTIDGRTTPVDSNNEETALRRFIDDYGFRGDKWARNVGIIHSGKKYTADFDLSVQDGDNTARALVEVKQVKSNLQISMVKRLVTVANHYHSTHLYLYTVNSDRWYRINTKDNSVKPCEPPHPGILGVDELFTPKRRIVTTVHGRRYYQSYVDTALSILKKV